MRGNERPGPRGRGHRRSLPDPGRLWSGARGRHTQGEVTSTHRTPRRRSHGQAGMDRQSGRQVSSWATTMAWTSLGDVEDPTGADRRVSRASGRHHPASHGLPGGPACSPDSVPGATTAAGSSSGCGSPSSSSAARVSGAVGSAFRDEFNLPDVESKTGFDILDDEFGGQGTGVSRHHRVPGRAGRRRPRGRRRRCRRCSTRSPSIDDVDRVAEPLRRGGRAADRRPRAPRPGRSPSPTSRCPTTSTSPEPARSATRSSRTSPEIDGPAGRARRLHLRRVRGAVVGGPRPRLRHRHPDPGLRLGAGHGPARRRRAVRHRHRHRAHHAAQQRAHDPRLRHVPRRS